MCPRQLFLILLLSLTSFATLAQENLNTTPIAKPNTIEPKHVYALAQLVDLELNEIRYTLGKEVVRQHIVKIQGAAPREVYFQAISLLKKINRLHFELTFDKGIDQIVTQHKGIEPASVWQVLSTCLTQLRTIKKHYNITTAHQLPALEENSLPSDVYLSVLKSSRQVNALLSQPYLPSDVYQAVTAGLYHIFSLQQKMPELSLQSEPDFMPGKKPKQVYAEMLMVYATIGQIFQVLGEKTLTLDALTSANIQPSDVYDIAILINSQLAHLHIIAQRELQPSQTAVYPGVKFPSHVFQRVKFQHAHLLAILAVVKENPQILTR